MVAQRVGDAGGIAVGVVAVVGGLVLGTDGFRQSAEAVKDLCAGTGQVVGGIGDLAAEAVAHVIQGVIDMVAQCIGDAHQPVGVIVAVGYRGGIRQGDFDQRCTSDDSFLLPEIPVFGDKTAAGKLIAVSIFKHQNVGHKC